MLGCCLATGHPAVSVATTLGRFWPANGKRSAGEPMTRLATEKKAAEAYGLELATFRDLVAGGRLPKPLAECGLYDLKAIDAAIDRWSGIGSPANAYDRWKGSRRAR
jgi:hypothetical protein